MVRDRIVAGISDNRLRGRLIETANLLLEMSIEKARTSEATEEQSGIMRKTVTAAVNEVRTQQQQQHKRYRSQNSKQSNEREKGHRHEQWQQQQQGWQ